MGICEGPAGAGEEGGGTSGGDGGGEGVLGCGEAGEGGGEGDGVGGGGGEVDCCFGVVSGGGFSFFKMRIWKMGRGVFVLGIEGLG